MTKSDISIVLDGKHYGSPGLKPLVPGQTVSGIVVFSPRTQKEVQDIDITFEGLCHTEVPTQDGEETMYHKETVPLFRFSQTLFRGPYTVQPTTLSWPFSFIFPKRSKFKRYNYRVNENNTLFNDGPQALPPSLDISPTFEAKVSYKLIAQVYSLSNTQKDVLSMVLMAPFSKQPLLPPCPKAIHAGVQTYRSNSLRSQQHSFKQKMLHAFTSNPNLKTPSIKFRTMIYMPSSASIRQYLPIAVSIQYQPEGPTDPPNPTLMLENATLHLKENASVRANQQQGGGGYVFASRDIVVCKQLALDDSPLEIATSKNTTTNSNLFRIRLADIARLQRLVPSFITYNINHRYELMLTISILHPETGHRFRAEASTVFDILSPYKESSNATNTNRELAIGESNQQVNRTALASDGVHGVSGGEVLPAYGASDVPAYEELSASK